MFILVFETNNVNYINKINYYFKDVDYKIMISDKFKKKINNNLILFKKEYYPVTGFNLNNLNALIKAIYLLFFLFCNV